MLNAHTHSALIRLASSLSRGSSTRRSLLGMLQTAAVQGKFYFFSPMPLEDFDPPSFSQLDWRDEDSAAIPVYGAERYAQFKKGLSTDSFAGRMSNYIYEIRSPVSLFDGSERDCYRLLKAGLSDLEIPSRNYEVQLSMSDIGAAARFMSSKSLLRSDIEIRNVLGVTTAGFKSLFDGVSIKGENRIFINIIRKSAVLVDGTAVRTDSGPKTENEIDFPEWVKSELVRYTDDASKKMKSGVLEWLLANTPKSYSSRRVYRGFGTQVDDFGDYSKLTLKEVNKRLYSRTGIRDIGQVRVGEPISVKRGKESSWSASAQAASNFASGLAEKSINFLVKAEVPASRVVIDFTELPAPIRRKFKFHGQAEVIVSPGPLEGVLGTLWLDKDFVTWLDGQGYDFIPQKGIFKR